MYVSYGQLAAVYQLRFFIELIASRTRTDPEELCDALSLLLHRIHFLFLFFFTVCLWLDYTTRRIVTLAGAGRKDSREGSCDLDEYIDRPRGFFTLLLSSVFHVRILVIPNLYYGFFIISLSVL